MRMKRFALALGAAAVFTAGGALYAQASHGGGAEGTTLTGCLNPGGQLKNLAVGDAPAGGKCGRNETMVHLGSGDITSVRTGDSSGLQGGVESGDADLGLQPSYRLPQNCSLDQVPKAVTNVWRCAEDDDTTYDAGAGLGLDVTTFSILPPYRLPQGCDPASVAKLASGSWVCAADEDTTYSAGRGVALDGTTFSLPDAYALPQGCDAGEVVEGDGGSMWVCATDDDTTYAAGRGLALDGTTFALPDGYALPQACADGQVAKSALGAWACASDLDTTYAAGAGMQLTGSLFELAQSFRLPQNCAADQVAKWATIMWLCAEDDDTTYTAGSGLVLAGTELSLDPAHGVTLGCNEGQVMKWDGAAWVCAADTDTTYDSGDFATSNQTCSTGSFVRGISASGAVICAAPPTGEGGGESATISIQSLAVGHASCPNGGTAITVDTTTSYACNGATGPQGPAGPTGPTGPAGSSGGAGVGTSPNGLFEIEVTDSGIVISGPGGNLKVGYSSATLENRGTP